MEVAEVGGKVEAGFRKEEEEGLAAVEEDMPVVAWVKATRGRRWSRVSLPIRPANSAVHVAEDGLLSVNTWR